MNDKPKDTPPELGPKFGPEHGPEPVVETTPAATDAGALAPEGRDASTPIEAEWEEMRPADVVVEVASDSPPETEDSASDDSAEPAPERTPAPAPASDSRGTASAILYVWLLLLTVGVGYLAYALLSEPVDQKVRLALADVPEIKTVMADSAAAAKRADANAAAIKALTAAQADAKAAGAAGFDALRQSVASLESALAEIRATSPGGGPSSEVVAAAQAAGEMASATATKTAAALAALSGDVSGRLDELAAAQMDIRSRIATLEERANKASGHLLARAMLALNDLRAGLASGKPFASFLGRAQTALPDAQALKEGAWVAYAAKGLPTDADLLAEMQALSLAIGQAALKDSLHSGESWLDRAVGGVVGRLKVRRVGAGVEGDDAAAIAARAEAALTEGNIAAAIAEVDAIDPTKADSGAARFTDWLARAKAAVAAKTDIDAVEQAAIAAADGA